MHHLKSDGDDSDIRKKTDIKVEVQKDIKESFEVGREDDPVMPNIWYPDGVLPGFRDACMDFYWVSTFDQAIYKYIYDLFSQQSCYDTEKQILKALALGFNLSEDYFLTFHTKADNQLRLLHYPRYICIQLEFIHE